MAGPDSIQQGQTYLGGPGSALPKSMALGRRLPGRAGPGKSSGLEDGLSHTQGLVIKAELAALLHQHELKRTNK